MSVIFHVYSVEPLLGLQFLLDAYPALPPLPLWGSKCYKILDPFSGFVPYLLGEVSGSCLILAIVEQTGVSGEPNEITRRYYTNNCNSECIMYLLTIKMQVLSLYWDSNECVVLLMCCHCTDSSEWVDALVCTAELLDDPNDVVPFYSHSKALPGKGWTLPGDPRCFWACYLHLYIL